MEKFIFTFGGNHPLRGFCQPVFASNYEKARERMCYWYGDKWCFQYTNQQWEDWKTKARNMEMKVEDELAPLYTREESHGL